MTRLTPTPSQSCTQLGWRRVVSTKRQSVTHWHLVSPGSGYLKPEDSLQVH